MSSQSWVRNWGDQTNDALSQLTASKRQVTADYNARIRLVKDAQRQGPNAAPHLVNLIRAPLAGLR